jgi:hypothetical protein
MWDRRLGREVLMFLACLCAPARCTATVARAKPLKRELNKPVRSLFEACSKALTARFHGLVAVTIGLERMTHHSRSCMSPPPFHSTSLALYISRTLHLSHSTSLALYISRTLHLSHSHVVSAQLDPSITTFFSPCTFPDADFELPKSESVWAIP